VHGTAEPLLAPQELLLGEAAHVGVGAAEVVRLVEELGQAGQCLGDLLKRVAAESCGGERLACLLDGGIGIDRPGDLGKELPGKGVRRVGPARKSLALTTVRDAEAALSGSCGLRPARQLDGAWRKAMYAGRAAGSWNKNPWPPW
jgi:hypothetical protein